MSRLVQPYKIFSLTHKMLLFVGYCMKAKES